jgi:hypothetical protein
MDSERWDRPAYEPCLRRRSSLLGDEEYDYDVPADASQHVSWPPPSSPQEEAEEEILVEEYMPRGLSEEEAIRLTMEQSELGQWEGLCV